jgi:hypothetical protein
VPHIATHTSGTTTDITHNTLAALSDLALCMFGSISFTMAPTEIRWHLPCVRAIKNEARIICEAH